MGPPMGPHPTPMGPASSYGRYFMLGFKVIWMQMETWLVRALTEKMIALPFECALQVRTPTHCTH